MVIKINRNKKKHNSSQQLLEYLQDILQNSTEFQVTTIVVDKIDYYKFIPQHIYRDIYLISQTHLKELKIHPSLWQRYLYLRKELELCYLNLLVNPNSEFYDSEKQVNIKKHIRLFDDPNLNWNTLLTKLPTPSSAAHQPSFYLEKLLNNNDFLKTLRQLGEIKFFLDKYNYHLSLSNNLNILPANIIYSDSKFSLDGTIVHQCSHNLLDYPQAKLFLAIHQENIKQAQNQWQNWLLFLGKLLKYFNE